LTVRDQNLMLGSMERTGPHRFAFFLVPKFPIYAVIPATEALRIACQNSGQSLYDCSSSRSTAAPCAPATA
jgi:transcriptional regulator GlxA family with amidase domain